MDDQLPFENARTCHMTPELCLKARQLLNWSQATLAQESGVSVEAIRRFESGQGQLGEITLQALAYRLEAQGLVSIEGHPPLRSGDLRGATPDPHLREDFEMIE